MAYKRCKTLKVGPRGNLQWKHAGTEHIAAKVSLFWFTLLRTTTADRIFADSLTANVSGTPHVENIPITWLWH